MTAANMAFKMPQEPRPLPSLESDEESFVVLGQSMPDCSNDNYISPLDLSVVSEAKSLINKELEELEQMRQSAEEKKKSLDHLTQEASKMQNSTVLPMLPAMEKGFESSNAISIASFSADMSSEEVQNKISQIIDENINLKDTILQNNITLKSQYEKIVAWQEDVQKVHQAHKEKLIGAKTFIEQLKKEKESLEKHLTKAAEVKNSLDAEIIQLKKDLKEKEHASTEVLVQRSDDNIKEFQLDVANKKIKDLEAENERLTAQVEKLTDENKVLIDNVTKVRFQEEDSRKKMEDLQNQVGNLSLKEIEKEDSYKKLEPQLKILTEERSRAFAQIMELREELGTKIQKEQSLMMTINSLKGQLELMNHAEETTNLKTQLTETQTRLTQVDISRAQAYSQIKQLTQDLSEIKNQPVATDEICALKVQLDVYKNDFEEERHAREVIKEEKDRLEEDLQNLQRRNQQLQEEIEMIRSHSDYVVYPNQASARRETVRKSAPPPEGACLRCPKCNVGYNNIAQLQSHVNRCIDLDDHLP